jgi:hypothetical protein
MELSSTAWISRPFNAPAAKGRPKVIKIRDGTEVAERYFVYKLYEATGGQARLSGLQLEEIGRRRSWLASTKSRRSPRANSSAVPRAAKRAHADIAWNSAEVRPLQRNRI